MTQAYIKKYLDYDPLSGLFRWKKPKSYRTKTGSIAGQSDPRNYRYIRIDGKLYAAHRLAWIYMYGKIRKPQIDHINGDPSDNRISNLREATPSENCQNVYSAKVYNKSSNILGVNWDKNKWVARIRVEGKRIQIGRFVEKKDAKLAYLLAKKKYHSFSNLKTTI